MDSGFYTFLQQIQHLKETERKLSDRTGENFNIFSILGAESREVSTHSAFLRELLDPNGSHSMGVKFLAIFLEKFGRGVKLDTATAKVMEEYYIGQISEDYSEGGRLDLVVEDGNQNRVIIENKIYAKDQKHQLLRYHKFDPQADLFYLTLYGEKASKDSVGDDAFEYTCLSYSEGILEWLMACRKEAVDKPVVREALSQYIELIRRLTNQTAKATVMENIKEMFIKTPEFSLSVRDAKQAWDAMVLEVKNSVVERLKEELLPIKLGGAIRVECVGGDDEDGFFIGYKLFDGEAEINTSALADRLFEALKKSADELLDMPKYTNEHWLGWFNPRPFDRGQTFESLSPDIICGLLGKDAEKKQAAFVQGIANQHSRAVELMRDAFLAHQSSQ